MSDMGRAELAGHRDDPNGKGTIINVN
jgi:hypothetical protein